MTDDDVAREANECATIAELQAEVARLREISRIARVQVDDSGDLWLHLDGGDGCCKASMNITAKAEHSNIIRKGVAQAAAALRGALARTEAGK